MTKKERLDDFEERREGIKHLSDEELKQRFWDLAEQLVDPLLEAGYQYTSPSIERSILLRMGFSSLEANQIVTEVIQRNLIGKGAGHIVYRVAKENDLTIRQAGLKLCDGDLWDQVMTIFKGGVA